MKYTTIDEILSALDSIMDASVQENNFLGLFAYIYRRTTAQIKSEIELGRFDDNERMTKFDVLFAGYYIEAYEQYQKQLPCSESWKISFDARNDNLCILQHVLLGMNAHINLDLAVAAARFMDGKPITDFENDFKKVNEILATLNDEMQARIGKASPMMFLLDWITNKEDERAISFGITQARGQSWRTAQLLWSLQGADREKMRIQVDHTVAKIASAIRNPRSGIVRAGLKVIKYWEEKNIHKIVLKLKM